MASKAGTVVPRSPVHFNFAGDVFDRWAQRRPDAPALWLATHTGAEQRFTFRHLSIVSRRAARFLHDSGIRPGDRVAVMLPRIPQWWIAMLALTRLGAVPVPCALLLTPREVTYRLETAQVSAVIATPEAMAKCGDFRGLRLLVGKATAGCLDFDTGVERASARFTAAKTRADAPGILYFTSATTGTPKMVLHTQASYGLAHRITGQFWLGLRPGDIHWNVSDLGWGKAAWSSFFGPWHMGACVFVYDFPGKFEPALALTALAHYPITTCCLPPTALRLMVREDLDRWKFARLRHCVTAGEPLNPEVFRAWKSATGLELHEGYGQTETVILVANSPATSRRIRPGSMGLAAPGYSVALLDDHLNPVPPGIEGEIAVRFKPDRPLGLFREYWLNPAEMERQFRGDWYLTGDRAVRDGQGYFWFIGRKDDVIKSSGYRIGPFEVESALMEHRAVLDVAVVGKPDEMRGQIVKAFVVLRSQVRPSTNLVRDLQWHCKQIVAPYKYPREIEFVSELPKTTSGKTRRAELRQRVSAAAAPPA